MTCVEKLAAFVSRASFDQLSPKARDQLKICVLDALACGLGALEAEPIRLIREQVDEFGGASLCTLIGGGRTAPDRAAFYNGALVRYLDFNDSFLAPGESCHPSDNLSPLLAAAEYAQSTGRDLLTALAVAYQIQCRLSEAAPVRDKGFDHTTQGAYAVAGGVGDGAVEDFSADLRDGLTAARPNEVRGSGLLGDPAEGLVFRVEVDWGSAGTMAQKIIACQSVSCEGT